MKTLTMVVSVLMLAGCSSWDMSGGGTSGASGSSARPNQSDESRPYTQRTLEPGDIYYGG